MHASTQISGGVFSDALTHGRGGATIGADMNGLFATCDTGERFAIGFAEMQIDMGGASGRMLFFRNPDKSVTIFSDDPKLAHYIKSLAPPAVTKQLDELVTTRRRRSLKLSAAVVSALSLVGILALIVYLQAGTWLRAAVSQAPRSVDEKLGDLVLQNEGIADKAIKDKVVSDAVNAMVIRLMAQIQSADSPYDNAFKATVHVVDNPVANAYALPNGHLVLHSGLLQKAASPDEVAGVLAHELAHVIHRHTLHRLAATLGVVGAVELLIGDLSALAAVGVNTYSRAQESQADATAVALMQDAGLSPEALASLLETISAQDAVDIPTWMNSHPASAERIAAIHEQLSHRAPKALRPLDIDWTLVQRALND